MPGSGSISAFATNFRDVRIVVMPHVSMAAVIDSRPAVKFKLTDVFPAIAVATLASAPPTDAGSSIPIRGAAA